MKMPGGSGASAVTLFDVGDNSRGGCSSVTYCEKLIAFGANISKKQASGVYSTTVIYTITSKPKPYVPSYTPTPSYGSGSSSSSDSSSGSSNSGSSSGSGTTHSSTDVAPPEDPQRKYCREKYGSSGVLFDYCYKYMHVSKADTVCPSYVSDYKKYRYCTSHDGDMSGYVEPSYPSYPSYPSTPDYGSGSSSGGAYDGGYDFSHPIRIQDPLDPNFPHP